MKVTQAAVNHDPVGDETHIAYGKDYYYKCSCGHSGGSLTNKSKAEYRARQHEKYCTGEATVQVQ